MERMTITVDVRERRSGVPSLLADLGAEVETVTLAVGDYAVGDRVVERKTVADLHGSLTDRRLWAQVGALRRDPRRGYLMVEGEDVDNGPVPARALRGALLKVLDNGIRVLRTTSPEDSALWFHVLAGQEQRRLGRRTAAQVGLRPIVTSPAGLLAAIPGIGVDRARGLITKFGSIANLAAASEQELQSIPGVGPARARAVLDALTRPRP